MSIPFTPETLAERWGVSANAIRQKCAKGELPHFRFGKLYRIPANVVEDYETCQTSASDAYAEATVSTGAVQTANAFGISLRHAPERKPKRKQ